MHSCSQSENILIAADLDYESLAGTIVVFQPEDTDRTIHIKIINDDIVESDEQFQLQLSPNKDEHVCLNQSNTATITIQNDDGMSLLP